MRTTSARKVNVVVKLQSRVLASAGIGIIPVWEFAVHSGCTVKSVLALVWLSPTPTMVISEMPTGESQGPMEAQLQWIRVPGVWKV